MKRYVTLLIICLPFLVRAKQLPDVLKDTVKDELSKESIPFASVSVLLGDELVASASKDFDGNSSITTLDAGEIGSGHSVTAIYEVILAGVPTSMDEEIDDLKYAPQLNASFTEELLTVKIRYKNHDADKSILLKKIVLAESTPFKKSSTTCVFQQLWPAAECSYEVRNSLEQQHLMTLILGQRVQKEKMTMDIALTSCNG